MSNNNENSNMGEAIAVIALVILALIGFSVWRWAQNLGAEYDIPPAAILEGLGKGVVAVIICGVVCFFNPMGLFSWRRALPVALSLLWCALCIPLDAKAQNVRLQESFDSTGSWIWYGSGLVQFLIFAVILVGTWQLFKNWPARSDDQGL